MSANLMKNKFCCVIKKGIFSEFTSEHFGSRGWLHHLTTMSYTYGDNNSDVVDQSAVKSRVPGVLGSIQLQQVAEITGEMSRMMKIAVNDTSSNVATNIKQQIQELKRQKARKKSAFTKARRAMLILLDEDLPSRREIRSQQQKVEDCQEKAMSVMETLIDMYTAVGDQESVKKINEELETLERECTSAQNRAQEYLDSRAHEESSGLSSCSSGKSTRRSMSKAKEDQIEQWRLESAERRKRLGELEKQTEVIKAKSYKSQDPRVIQEKEEEILR